MLVNLSPKNNFCTEREKQRTRWIRYWGKDEDIHSKSEWVSFDRLFKPTQYTGVYNSDFDEDIIDTWTKQVSYFGKGYKLADDWIYGVADNIEQVIELYNKNEEGLFSGNHVISYFEVKKSPECGWRWRKWGPYIGIKEPKCEYLADEPEIESVICFSIYKVR